jgi:hypothetical protein
MDFPTQDGDLLLKAVEALWAHPHLQGCWRESDREPEVGTRVIPRVLAEDSGDSLFGLASVHGRYVVPCATYFALSSEFMSLSLSLREGALRRYLPDALEPEGPCGPRLFGLLAGFGRHVHEAVPIKSAGIGWEAIGLTDDEIRTGRYPHAHVTGYLLPHGGALTFCPPVEFSRP